METKTLRKTAEVVEAIANASEGDVIRVYSNLYNLREYITHTLQMNHRNLTASYQSMLEAKQAVMEYGGNTDKIQSDIDEITPILQKYQKALEMIDKVHIRAVLS